MNNLYKHIVFISLFVISFAGFAQQQNLPLNRAFNLVNQKEFNSKNNQTHTSFQPIIQSFIKTDSLTSLSKSAQKYYLININKTHLKNRSWFARKLFYENFIVIDSGNFYLTIDPLFNLEKGVDNQDTNINKPNLYKNTRGIIFRGNIGKKLSFQSVVYENQANLPLYLSNYVSATNVVPGQGRIKQFKGTGFDYNSATANISYTPAKFINLQIGNGKNFIGDGYRSLLLSDVAYNYPYFKITVQFGKQNQFQYTKLNAALSNLVRRESGSTTEALFTRKSMSVHYFSWLAAKWLNIGLFESTIWQTEDNKGTKAYNFQQLNPIIFVNTLQTGFNTKNHSLIGSNLKIKLPFKTVVYNQFVYDGNDKYGYQVGIKSFAINNLTLQAEYNKVTPYTYSSEVTLQNYSHFNEALAHPLGANFNEFVGIINYKYKRFFTQLKINLANTQNEGNNIFISPNLLHLDVNNVQVYVPIVNTKITTFQAHIGYLINPKNNMSLVLGVTNRNKEVLNTSNRTNYIYFAFRTNLRNLYNDF